MLPPPKLNLGPITITKSDELPSIQNVTLKKNLSVDEELALKKKKTEDVDPSLCHEAFGNIELKKEFSTEGKVQCKRCENWMLPQEYPDHFVSHSSEILDFLFLGAMRNASNFKELTVRTNITHILNIAYEVQNYFPEHFKYLKIAAEDVPGYSIKQHFEECFEFINDARTSGGRVLVHCVQGMSRSASIVIAYLMYQEKYTLKKAFEYCKEIRSVVRPNPFFIDELIELEKELFGETTITKKEILQYKMKGNANKNEEDTETHVSETIEEKFEDKIEK